MGRPREFNRDEVLNLAIEVFRGKGYKGTSVQDLLGGMGINRSSFYSTFGDKHQLFLEAFDRYAKRRRDDLCLILAQPGPRKPLLRRYFGEVIEDALSPPIAGCLLISSAVEFAAQNPTMADRLSSSFVLMENLFYDTLVEAREKGEVSSNLEPRALARFLVNSLRGLRLTAKVTRQREVLLQVVEATLSILDEPA
jgi:TetR/AcrR family transcriptional repressor of nem operon